jgi:hypothetical protein
VQGIKVVDNDWAGAIREAFRRKGDPPESEAVIFINSGVEVEDAEQTGQQGEQDVARN